MIVNGIESSRDRYAILNSDTLDMVQKTMSILQYSFK